MNRRRLSLLAWIVLAAPAHAADPQPYTVSIGKTGDAPVDAAAAAASSLASLRKIAPVGAFALVSRAQADAARILLALHSEGFYAGSVAITIDGRPTDDPSLPALLDARAADRPVAVRITATLGPRYTLGAIRLHGTIPDPIRARFALHTGQPAQAAPVIAAGTALLAALQDDGYALATVAAPIAIANDAAHTLDIDTTATIGPRVDIGPIALTGLRAIHPAFVRRRLLLHQGDRYNPDKIEAARQDLASLPVFASVRVQATATLDPQGQLPIDFAFTERLRHVVSLGVAYSTDLGASANVTWTDRNLFGGAQQLILSASATELGGSDAKQPGYNVSATYLIPDWLRRDQSLQFDAIALREYLDSYDRTAATLDARVDRKLDKHLTISAGISGTRERVGQEGTTRDYTFVGVPLGARYDTTDSLLGPIHGWRVSGTVTPTEAFGTRGGAATYVLLRTTGSTYLNFATPGRSVLALRATLAASEGTSQFGLPPDQRVYAGGSDTIRGYKYQFVGPQFPDHTPQGGTALDAATVEFRQRFGRSYGAAFFVDAGQVATSGIPFSGSLHTGAGIGARYYTAIGPIRIDVAVPLQKVPGSGPVQAYIGIGEAF